MTVSLRAQALSYLARREYSQIELTTKLLRKGFAVVDVNAVVARLAEEKLIDDERCFESVFNMLSQRGYGPNQIRQRMFTLGFTSDDKQQDIQGKRDWRALMHEAWKKKFGQWPNSRTEFARQARFLQYRGFSSSLIVDFLKASSEDFPHQEDLPHKQDQM